MKVKSESEVTHLCPTLSDLMDCSLPGSSIHGIFQARVLEWGAIAYPQTESSLHATDYQEETESGCCSLIRYTRCVKAPVLGLQCPEAFPSPEGFA